MLKELFGIPFNLQFAAGDDFNEDSIQDDQSDDLFEDTDGENSDDDTKEIETEEETDDDETEDDSGEEEIEIEIDSLDDEESEDDSIEKKVESIAKKFKNDPAKMAKAIAELEKTLGKQGKEMGDLRKQLDGKKPDETKEQKQEETSEAKIEPIDEVKFDADFLDAPLKNTTKVVENVGDKLIREKVLPVLQPLTDILPELQELINQNRNYRSQVEAQKRVETVAKELRHEYGDEEFDAILPIMEKHKHLIKSPNDVRPLFKKIRTQLLAKDKLDELKDRMKSEKAVFHNGKGSKPKQSGKREITSDSDYLDDVFGSGKSKTFKA